MHREEGERCSSGIRIAGWDTHCSTHLVVLLEHDPDACRQFNDLLDRGRPREVHTVRLGRAKPSAGSRRSDQVSWRCDFPATSPGCAFGRRMVRRDLQPTSSSFSKRRRSAVLLHTRDCSFLSGEGQASLNVVVLPEQIRKPCSCANQHHTVWSVVG